MLAGGGYRKCLSLHSLLPAYTMLLSLHGWLAAGRAGLLPGRGKNLLTLPPVGTPLREQGFSLPACGKGGEAD